MTRPAHSARATSMLAPSLPLGDGLYRFTAGSPWGAAGGATVISGALALALPARSVTPAHEAPAAAAHRLDRDRRDDRGAVLPPGHHALRLAASGHVETRTAVRVR